MCQSYRDQGSWLGQVRLFAALFCHGNDITCKGIDVEANQQTVVPTIEFNLSSAMMVQVPKFSILSINLVSDSKIHSVMATTPCLAGLLYPIKGHISVSVLYSLGTRDIRVLNSGWTQALAEMYGQCNAFSFETDMTVAG